MALDDIANGRPDYFAAAFSEPREDLFAFYYGPLFEHWGFGNTAATQESYVNVFHLGLSPDGTQRLVPEDVWGTRPRIVERSIGADKSVPVMCHSLDDDPNRPVTRRQLLLALREAAFLYAGLYSETHFIARAGHAGREWVESKGGLLLVVEPTNRDRQPQWTVTLHGFPLVMRPDGKLAQRHERAAFQGQDTGRMWWNLCFSTVLARRGIRHDFENCVVKFKPISQDVQKACSTPSQKIHDRAEKVGFAGPEARRLAAKEVRNREKTSEVTPQMKGYLAVKAMVVKHAIDDYFLAPAKWIGEAAVERRTVHNVRHALKDMAKEQRTAAPHEVEQRVLIECLGRWCIDAEVVRKELKRFRADPARYGWAERESDLGRTYYVSARALRQEKKEERKAQREMDTLTVSRGVSIHQRDLERHLATLPRGAYPRPTLDSVRTITASGGLKYTEDAQALAIAAEIYKRRGGHLVIGVARDPARATDITGLKNMTLASDDTRTHLLRGNGPSNLQIAIPDWARAIPRKDLLRKAVVMLDPAGIDKAQIGLLARALLKQGGHLIIADKAPEGFGGNVISKAERQRIKHRADGDREL